MATTSPPMASSHPIRSLIPARIDRLPWSKFHTRLVIALGVAWVLDGLEITIAANVGPVTRFAPSDLVDFIQEDYAAPLHAL